MLRLLALFVALPFLSACAGLQEKPSAEAAKALAPTGKLRAAINFGNPILASKGPGGEPAGVSVDLARELGRRLGVPVELVTFDAAGKVAGAATANVWDIAFVAIDPKRGETIAYSPPYVVIEGAYLVRNDSPLRANDEVDRKGNRVVVGRASAYDLYLTRALKEAEIVRVATSPMVVSEFLKGNYEVAAGVKQQLEADAKKQGGVRLLPGRFMVINQAMGTPRGRPGTEAAASYLRSFVEEMKASGFVAKALERHRVEGAGVAPAGDAR